MPLVKIKCLTESDFRAFLVAFSFADKLYADDKSILRIYKPNRNKAYERIQWYLDQWWGMPTFDNGFTIPTRIITILAEGDDYLRLAQLTKISVRLGHHYGWFPAQNAARCQYIQNPDEPPRMPKYPVYIVSLGRSESRYTAKRLDEAKVPYTIVVEPAEYKCYCQYIAKDKILVLPKNYSHEKLGSIPARNFVWTHAYAAGVKRHWILDDNIEYFLRLNKNKRQKVVCVGAMLAAAEDFVDRYTNVGLAGFHGSQCVKGVTPTKPFLLNTRVYSCILIRNNLPFRWRGRYNEDTDLSLRVLKSGKCTVLFNAMLFNKHTMRIKGGNTDGIYQHGRLMFAQSLAQQHPDVARVVHRFGRWHHMVDYRPFRCITLVPKKGGGLDQGCDDYGMILVKTPPRRKKIRLGTRVATRITTAPTIFSLKNTEE